MQNGVNGSFLGAFGVSVSRCSLTMCFNNRPVVAVHAFATVLQKVKSIGVLGGGWMNGCVQRACQTYGPFWPLLQPSPWERCLSA